MERFQDIDPNIPGKMGGFGGNRPPRRPGMSGDGGGDAFGGRVPPQNIEAEIAVLGAMMLGERGAAERASEMITRDDFYRDAHGQIFDAMLHLAEKDEPVDIITLKDELGRRGMLEPIGGIGYLMQLGEFVPTTANLQYHATIVREKAILRRLIEAASRIAGMAYGEVDEVDTIVDMAERTIFEVARKRSAQGFMPLRPLLNEAFEQVDVAYHEKGMVTGLDTGFEDLNYMTSGFQDGDLIIVAARPSMGKCIKYDNWIVDPATGERLTIQAAVERQQATVMRLGENGTVEASPVSHWVDSGVQPCWRVTTRTGRFVEVTGHHPFLTVDGWTPLHDIKPGQYIATARSIPVCPATYIPTEEVKLPSSSL
ncbi:MAG: intein-containing replicative DNA helicase, partial [Armatimonadetes bacterium]|nr:intein-containing replicative DNA helicase [Armatimonadota bacterium]